MHKDNIIFKQKKYMILSRIFPVQAFISSVLVIFYLSHLNISLSEYLILDGILFILIAVLEIPSGFISDYFGRKKVLIIGRVTVLISMLILLISKDFIGGLCSIILASIGSSLSSGNEQAILYEYFLENDSIDKFKVLNSNVNSLALGISAIYSILSGFIFKVNAELVLWLDILFLVTNILIIFLFLKDKHINGNKSKHMINKNKVDEKKDFYNEIKSVKKTIIAFIIIALIFSFFRVTYNYYQPIYESQKFKVETYGIINVFFIFISMLGTQIYSKFFRKIKSEAKQVLILILLLILTSIFLFIGKNNSIIIILILSLQQIIRGINTSLTPIFINDVIYKETNYRTSYISIFSTITTLITAIFIFISSIISNSFNVYIVFLILSICILSISLIMNLIYKKYFT